MYGGDARTLKKTGTCKCVVAALLQCLQVLVLTHSRHDGVFIMIIQIPHLAVKVIFAQLLFAADISSQVLVSNWMCKTLDVLVNTRGVLA